LDKPAKAGKDRPGSSLSAWPMIQAVNRALARECGVRTGVHFIPTARAFLGAGGQPQADLFVDDRLHLNELGYRIWSAIIKSHLDARLHADN
jgi:lysophospholipase L1-like esterase